MSAVVFEHVPVTELPAAWRAKLTQATSATVTARIEEESQAAPRQASPSSVIDDPAFGIWRDRDDMADVAEYVRKIREPRYDRGGSGKKP